MKSLINMFRKQKRRGLVGMSLDDSGMGIAVVEWRNSQPLVVAMDYVPVTEDLTVDELKLIATKFGLGTHYCSLLLGARDYSLVITDAPNVPEAELADAVRWKVKDLVDIPVAEAVMDVFEMPGSGLGANDSVNVVVARKGAITRRMSLFSDANVNLDIIDIPELSQRNLMRQFSDPDQPVIMLSLQQQRGLLTISRADKVFLNRNLDMGYDAVAHAQDPQFALDQVVLEIQRSMDYFESFYRMAPVKLMKVAPCPVDMSVLAAYVQSNLGLQVELLDFVDHIEFADSVDTDRVRNRQACLFALGAALRQQEKAA